MNEEWKSYKKLLLKGMEEWEIYDLLKKGLQPHDSFTKKLIPCPKSLHEYYHLLDDELIIAVQRGLFLFNQLDSEKIEATISQNGFILVHEKSWLVDRLDRLTDTYIISDEYFDKLRQKDGQYRITSKEIACLKEHLSKLTKEQDIVIERIAKVFESDSDLNSWQNLVQISSEEQKEKFSEALQNVTFLEDDFNKIVSSQLKKDKTIGRPKDHSPDKSDNYEYCFQNKGAKWCVKFAGQDRYVDHVDGFYYIALLLERPNKTIKTSELYYAIRGMDVDQRVIMTPL